MSCTAQLAPSRLADSHRTSQLRFLPESTTRIYLAAETNYRHFPIQRNFPIQRRKRVREGATRTVKVLGTRFAACCCQSRARAEESHGEDWAGVRASSQSFMHTAAAGSDEGVGGERGCSVAPPLSVAHRTQPRPLPSLLSPPSPRSLLLHLSQSLSLSLFTPLSARSLPLSARSSST